MIRILFVGDGERDAATNPPLLKNIAGADVDAHAIPWPRLNRGGSGYDRKLLFALRVARAESHDGLIATIDKDRSPGRERLRALEDARRKDRERSPPLPTALGCADPHAEAWLLDDPVALRHVLRLDPDTHIPTVRATPNPKGEIAALHRSSARANTPALTILAELAQHLQPSRCVHARETGFADFIREIKTELGSLFESS